ncbi:MAG: dephospho-CoA kinase [Phycisphaerales bacterium]|nr:MAG: dephospho-CoA kinase [Phycisphaerales bacterium]
MERAPFLVLGLAGGIGSGKSAVAGILKQMGYVVSDSDAQARAVLERPEVIAELVRTLGPGVVDAQGRPDRRAIADLVFADADKRAALEAIVHPRLHRDRAELIARARAQGAPGVVIDAPLLFEAGVDAECDAVLFVDSPRQARLQRVMAHRGWSAEELARREAAQMPLDEKRRRSDVVIVNDGDLERLRQRVARALAELQARSRR